MWKIIRPLYKALLLIVGLAVLLLLVDRSNRAGRGGNSLFKETTLDSLGLAGHPAGVRAPLKLPRKLNLYLIQYNDSPISDESLHGILDGLRLYGLVEGRDFVLKLSNAQGDMATLNLIVDAARSEHPDLVFVTSTPTLQVAVKKLKGIPVVFSVVADPLIAGAGTSFTDHLPNVTGISTLGDFSGLVALLSEVMPGIKTIGSLFTPGEPNSLKNLGELKKAAKLAGYELITVPINASSETAEAALTLMARKPDAVCQIVDNLTSLSFEGIIMASRKAGIPLFGFVGEQAFKGAVMVRARDYHQAGIDAVDLAARIFRGADPRDIPFAFVSKSKLIVNEQAAADYAITIPTSVLARADSIIKIINN